MTDHHPPGEFAGIGANPQGAPGGLRLHVRRRTARWHEGRLWFSDTVGGRILSVGEDSLLAVEVEVPRPSGLGWLPDGRLVVATPGFAPRGALGGPSASAHRIAGRPGTGRRYERIGDLQ